MNPPTVPPGSAAKAKLVSGLYAVADGAWLEEKNFAAAVAAAIDGGARLIQYRDKAADRDASERTAGLLAALCRERGVPLILNDDVDLAARVGADGVHLGRDDADLGQARATLGPRAIIGVSCYNELERARAAQGAGADYVAFGRFFPSRTKPQAVPASLELLRAARSELRIPIVAIGGITPDNGKSLIDAGADALAVIEGVFNQPDIRAAAARYANLFRQPAESP
ncbi:MAG: thiamine phosphate synthase [Pseudomonadota bacterium]